MSPTYRYPRPAVTADVVFLATRDGEPEVLVIRRAAEPFRGRWALPGGFVDMDEDLDRAARRELKEETGVSVARLRQIGAYGRVGRDPRGRTVSVAYLAIWPGPGPRAVAGDDASASEWRSPSRLGRMAFDHAHILADGREELARLLEADDEAFLELLPRSFTLEGVADFLAAWTGRRPRPSTLRRRWEEGGSIVPASKRAAGSPARYRYAKRARGSRR